VQLRCAASAHGGRTLGACCRTDRRRARGHTRRQCRRSRPRDRGELQQASNGQGGGFSAPARGERWPHLSVRLADDAADGPERAAPELIHHLVALHGGGGGSRAGARPDAAGFARRARRRLHESARATPGEPGDAVPQGPERAPTLPPARHPLAPVARSPRRRSPAPCLALPRLTRLLKRQTSFLKQNDHP